MSTPTTDLPKFLSSSEAFGQHLKDQFEGSDNNTKGESFLDFAMRIVVFCDYWHGFQRPKKNPKKTHDKGIDFFATSDSTDEQMCGQSKFHLREVADFDSVISKFKNYETEMQKLSSPKQLPLTGLSPKTKSPFKFILATGSNIGGIVKKYEQSGLSSKTDYERYKSEGRFEILDITSIYPLLESLYRRSYLIAPDVDIEFVVPYIKLQNVYISVVNGRTLSDLHKTHGDGLFFENIREFLGTNTGAEKKREGVNDEIAETLRNHPKKMLERNNGVTIRAESVVELANNKLKLRHCGIVNGCQTTMSIVEAGDSKADANILTKIVKNDDSWDVAKSANYQNSVSRMELDLARFLRPQLVAKAAIDAGMGPTESSESSVSSVLEAIHLQKISYEAMKLLYLGIFSRFPNNMFESNYVELRIDVLNEFYKGDKSDYLMRILFDLQRAMKNASNVLKSKFDDVEYTKVFARFFQDDKLQYRCLLAILTACGCTGEDLYEKPTDTQLAYSNVERFIKKLEIVLTVNTEYFGKVYAHSFIALAGKILDAGSDGTEQDLAQRMFREVTNSAGVRFRNMLTKLQLSITNDDSLKAIAPDFSALSP